MGKIYSFGMIKMKLYLVFTGEVYIHKPKFGTGSWCIFKDMEQNVITETI